MEVSNHCCFRLIIRDHPGALLKRSSEAYRLAASFRVSGYFFRKASAAMLNRVEKTSLLMVFPRRAAYA